MIKPIVYHDIREKKKLEANLFSKIPLGKRKAASKEFIDLFSGVRNTSRAEAAYAVQRMDYATKSTLMENLHLNINLNIQQLVDVVKQLSPDEKLILNEAIWSENMDIPQEHQDLVMNRIEKNRQNPDRMLDWDDASKKLKP